MDDKPRSRVQLCGMVVVESGDGRWVPAGRQPRLLIAFLTLHRNRVIARSELPAALWGSDEPPAAEDALSALLSKARRLTGWRIEGRGVLKVRAPDDLQVDTEIAVENLHAAEAALLQGRAGAAHAGSITARYITARPFLPDCDLPWVVDMRAMLADMRLRALECFVAASIELGGVEIQAATKAADELVDLAPFRESGHSLRLRALTASGNRAEALLAYDVLRGRLRDELGVDPGPELQALHRELLG